MRNHSPSNSNVGTAVNLPSAPDLTVVSYDAVTYDFTECEYTIDPKTGHGTILNAARAREVTRNASINLTWHTGTKRANSAWTIIDRGPPVVERTSSSTNFRSEAFYLPGEGLAVASGVTEGDNGSKKATILARTGPLGPYPKREAEGAPITYFAASQSQN